MGAEFNCRVYPDTLNKNGILEKWRTAVDVSRHEDGHSYSGAIGMLRGDPEWQDKQFNSREDAEDYLCDKHEKWSGPLAVSFVTDKGKYWVIGGWCSS